MLTALGNIGSASAGDNIAKVLLSGDIDERVVAAKTLKTCFTPGVEDTLFVAVDDEVGAVRAQVVRTLGLLAQQELVDRQKVISVCKKAIHDSGWWVRKYAAESLAGLGEDGLVVLRQIVAGEDKYASERAEEQLLLSGGENN